MMAGSMCWGVSCWRRFRVCWMVLAGAGWLTTGCANSPTSVSMNPRWTYDEGAPVRGDKSQKRFALIFTGGEHGEGTAHILDILDTAGIHASFFVTGDYLAVPAYPDLVRRMVAEGHYVGPHSHSHPLYCDWEDRGRTLVTESFFRRDLEQNIADLRELGALRAGEPVYFIPPSEWYNAEQVRWARDMGVTLFNFTPGSGSNRDWIPEQHAKFVSSRMILDRVLEFERNEADGLNGFLLLLHLGSQRRDKMHLLLSPLIDELRNRGYAFVRVDELIHEGGDGAASSVAARPHARSEPHQPAVRAN